MNGGADTPPRRPAEKGRVSTATARTATLLGAASSLASTFLAWSYGSAFPGDLTIYGYPGGAQVHVLVLAAVAIALLLIEAGPLRRVVTPGGAGGTVRVLASGVFLITAFTVIAIGVELGGMINVEWGGWVALLAASVFVVAARLLPADRPAVWSYRLPDWVEFLVIAVVLGLALAAFVQALAIPEWEIFLCYLVALGAALAAAWRLGPAAWISAVGARHRGVTVTAAFVVAAAFPFTQGSDNHWLNVMVNVGIFATTAIGLNIVVGLAGLLDLGYVAFLGVGAYVGALLSGAAASSIGWNPPFAVTVVIGAVVTAIVGVIIGTPTLRVRGDYLAIVTLGFGEIFRITVNNLDGSTGPQVTNGPNGIPGIPDLTFLGVDFGRSHTVFGMNLGYFANYFFLELVLIAFVILVFSRMNNSRLGRAWLAIREDEVAAQAAGINTFRLKLLAFALGATLAGMAGTIQAHAISSITPDSYQFLNSAFLVAAVVLGGMGTVTGAMLGSVVLLLLPEKFRFFQDNKLLIFGLTLVLMMRFRPEGMIANKRRQAEFHEEEISERLGREARAEGAR
ncbi:branched-chain amino acid ABC transporter permease [Sphaerimonospora sp. CA-214678]|uniref:branched-chain amino acid ABC transporter permease n=1 Tax=Sphaerimonospora sp. CA-214678 TaxID=3240029 RepID=UPI003D8EAD29